MELQCLAQAANEIFGTGQVFRAERNLTPPNGTKGGGGGEKGCGRVRHAFKCFTAVGGVCVAIVSLCM